MNFPLPELGEGVYEAETVRWLVKAGDTVKPGQPLLEVLTDKATMEVPAPFAGAIETLHLKEGQKVKIGDNILDYRPAGHDAEPKEAKRHDSVDGNHVANRGTRSASVGKTRGSVPPAAHPVARNVNGPPTAAPSPGAVKAAPSVRLMARKLGIDLATIHGSGPQGRVLVDDLTAAVKSVEPSKPKPPVAKENYGTPGERIKLAGLRRKIAEHLVHAKQVIPHYTYVDECDVTDLVKLRDLLKDAYAAKGAKLTYLAFLVKAVVAALKEVPIVNASLDDEAGEIILHDQYHIGVAVAVPGGLIVPVVRDADKLSLLEIATAIERLSSDARAGKSKLEDLRGGTFTVTSIGNVGGLFSTPIIDHPQVGILGLGKIMKRPIYDDKGQIKPADMLYLSFSFDHRVVDGAVGCNFGNAVMRRLRNPGTMLVD